MNKLFLENLMFVIEQENTVEANYVVDILSVLNDVEKDDENIIEVAYKLLSELKSYGVLKYNYGYNDGYAEGYEDSETEQMDN